MTQTASAGKIGVLMEEDFDQTEYRIFNEHFPGRGYEVEYISHFWASGNCTSDAIHLEGVSYGKEDLDLYI